jgi:hypothetical protein
MEWGCTGSLFIEWFFWIYIEWNPAWNIFVYNGTKQRFSEEIWDNFKGKSYKITSDDRRCSSHLKNPFYRGSIKGDGKWALCQWCLSCFGPSLLSMGHVGTVWPDVSAQSGSTLFVPVYVFIVC